jgi:hypothetical protein
LSTRGLDLLRRAHHLLHGGRDREGVELLCSLDLQARPPPLPLTECALEASVRLGLPARTIHQLRSALLRKAPMVMAVDTFHKQFPFVLAQLEHDSGLAFFRELSELPLSQRLEPALTRAQERYLATPEHDRVYSPIDAIRELARFSASACSLGMQIYDLEFIERLPSLEPLLPLSPALAVVGQMIAACKDALGGRTLVATHAYEAVLARLAEPDRAGFDETYYRGIRLGIHYLLGLVDASMGMASAEKHAQLLEADREHRVNAWRVRVSLHLNQGNAEEARKCMRRAELLQLQEGDEQRYIGTSAGFELIAHAMIGDLIGVKRALDAVATLAEHYPGWRPVNATTTGCKGISSARSRFCCRPSRWLRSDVIPIFPIWRRRTSVCSESSSA